MPSITATIDRDQRDGLYELIRNHLGAIGDVWIALEESGDFASGSASSSAKTSVCSPTSAGSQRTTGRRSS
jgi:hypothetical protein